MEKQEFFKIADYSTNNIFNLSLEQLARTVAVPGTNKYWFYERVKGTFDLERRQQTEEGHVEEFDAMYPKQLVFRRESVAKVWRCWEVQKPNSVLKGEARNYAVYINDVVAKDYVPDVDYYKQTIALLIIYRYLTSNRGPLYETDKNAVACYVLAYLKTLGTVDLLAVWEAQSLSDEQKQQLDDLSTKVHGALIECAGADTIELYAKSKPAYQEVLKALQA